MKDLGPADVILNIKFIKREDGITLRIVKSLELPMMRASKFVNSKEREKIN
jgi:hypothetical protein